MKAIDANVQKDEGFLGANDTNNSNKATKYFLDQSVPWFKHCVRYSNSACKHLASY